MSKKKNTLKDLDDFLKQQAASLVAPEKLSEKVEEKTIAPVSVNTSTPEEVTAEKILHDLKTLSSKEKHTFRANLYTIIIQSLEAQDHSSPEDKMLINTALYLKSGSHWKETIRSYWKGK